MQRQLFLFIFLSAWFFWYPNQAQSEVSIERYNELIAEGKRVAAEIDQLNSENQQLAQTITNAKVQTQLADYQTTLLSQITEVITLLGSSSKRLATETQRASSLHQKWIADLRSVIKKEVPHWDAIKTVEDLVTTQTSISNFEERVPSEKELLAVEHSLESLLIEEEYILNAARARIEFLIGKEEFKTVLGRNQIAHGLEKLKELSAFADKRLRANLSQRSVFIAQHQVRTKLRSSVPLLWKKILRSRTAQLGINLAVGIQEQHQRTLNDPIILTEVSKKVADARRSIYAALNDRHSPKMSLRQVRILGVLVQDLEKNLPKFPISDTMRPHIVNEIEIGKQTFDNRFKSLTSLTEADLRVYFKKRLDTILKVSPQNQFSQACSVLAKSVEKQGLQISSEIAFEEFLLKCAQP